MTAILRARAPPDREVQTKNIDRYDTALFFPETKQAEIKAIVASARGWLPKAFRSTPVDRSHILADCGRRQVALEHRQSQGRLLYHRQRKSADLLRPHELHDVGLLEVLVLVRKHSEFDVVDDFRSTSSTISRVSSVEPLSTTTTSN